MRHFLRMKRKIIICFLLIFVICIVFLFVRRRWIGIDDKQGKILNTPSILFIYYQGWSSDDMDYVEIIDSYGVRYEISGDSLKGVKLEDIYDLYETSQLEGVKKIGKVGDLVELKEKYKMFLHNIKGGKVEQEGFIKVVVPEDEYQCAEWLGIYKKYLQGMKYVSLQFDSSHPVNKDVEELCTWIHKWPQNLKSRRKNLFP